MEADLTEVTDPEEAIELLTTTTPTAVLATDPALADKEYEKVLNHVLSYVRNGGTIVFGCMFSSFISPNRQTRFFQRKFGFPWETGSYHRTTVHLNQNMSKVDKDLLPATYSQKAVFLKHVHPDDAMYRPDSESVLESLVFSPDPVDTSKTPVAFKTLGQGRVGYIGDVNAEDGSDMVILAMCGLT